MLTFIALAIVSTIGWLVSFAFRRSAARRHAVLLTTLVGCLLLPPLLELRAVTDWRLVAIPAWEGVRAASEVERHMDSKESQAACADREVPRASELLPSTDEPIRRDSAPSVAALETAVCPTSPTPVGSDAPSATGEGVEFAVQQTGAFGFDPATIGQALWGLYALVAGGLLLRVGIALVAVGRSKSRGIEVDLLPGGVRVLESDVAVPLAVGFGRPVILLPRRFVRTTRGDVLADVYAHELEHLRRGDHWVMLVQQVAAALYWPLVTMHLVNRSLSRAREELCDNAVLAGRDPVEYGQSLLEVAEAVTCRQALVGALAPAVVGRGKLEGRIAGLLDPHRDRRTRVGQLARWGVAALLAAGSVLVATTRVIAEEQEVAAAESVAPREDITWSGIPSVDRDSPTLHRGVVIGPDGNRLAGAKIHAASTFELLEWNNVDHIGPVRAVTDAEGRFEFEAPDLSSSLPSGEIMRWETLLVATKEGVAPGWLKTWGGERSARSHWHPHINREVAIQTRPPATLSGELKLAGGEPLAGARVRVTGMMAPVEYDLDVHIPREEEVEGGLFSMVDYAEMLFKPAVLPGIETEATTDDAGRFELSDLPEGFIANIEITHPLAVTTSLRVAVRPIETVYQKPFDLAATARALQEGKKDAQAQPLPAPPKPIPVLYGSGFSLTLAKCAVLRGRVFESQFSNQPAAGVTVGLANHNTSVGMYGQLFTTDEEGRFEVTGLSPRAQGYELAFAGSFAAPYGSHRQTVLPGVENRVKLTRAVPYRLKLVDQEGQPIDRPVYSIAVQVVPGTVHRGIKRHFNEAKKVAPGVYEGIVPVGPGAVLVERKSRRDRPAAVDPKAFFEPGRSDWTFEEERYAYGDAWHIVQPAVRTTEQMASGSNYTIDQLDLAAAQFTRTREEDKLLELTATVYRDPPVEVTLVDEQGVPVQGATVERQLNRYKAKDLPPTFPVYGLHPERAELLVFSHEERGLIGTLYDTWSAEPVRVEMERGAVIQGRITDDSGKPNDDFMIRVLGERLMPGTYVAGRQSEFTVHPGERRGEFRLVVPPGFELSGEFVRRQGDWHTRAAAAPAFGPLTLTRGQTKDLGDLVVP